MILLLVFVTLLTCPTSALVEWQLRYESLTNEVQTHLNLVLSEKYTHLYKDMHQNCVSQYKPQAIIHLHIFNGSKTTTNQDEVVIWETKEAPCSLRLFSTTDSVLKEWCSKNPQKFVNYPYNHTGESLWNEDPNFVTAVQVSCHRFRSGEDFNRISLRAPMDFRHEQIILFVCFAILMSLVALGVGCVYCHRVPMSNYATTRWEKYWEYKEWVQFNAIIEHREQLIKEYKEIQLKEQQKAGIVETPKL